MIIKKFQFLRAKYSKVQAAKCVDISYESKIESNKKLRRKICKKRINISY